LAEIQEENGESVYFRLSTRPVEQPERIVDPVLAEGIIGGGYWLREPGPESELAIAYCGAVAPEAIAAFEAIREDLPEVGVLAVTSPDRLHRDWRAAASNGKPGLADRLLNRLRPDAAIVTVADSHPATLSWLGSIARHLVVPLGVDQFGQSGDLPDLYGYYGIDQNAIIEAAARACLRDRSIARIP
jgi:pyruvate dehydrogenase E1 component